MSYETLFTVLTSNINIGIYPTKLVFAFAFNVLVVTDQEQREWQCVNRIRGWDCGPRHATIEMFQRGEEKVVQKSCSFSDIQGVQELSLLPLFDGNRHPNVASITHLFLDQDDMDISAIGLPSFYEKNLSHFLCYDRERFTFEVALRIFSQIVQGLAFLHACHIIHHDMCPENVLVKDRELTHVALCDLGLGVHQDGTFIENSELDGRYSYRAPERMLSFKSDIYALQMIGQQLFYARAKDVEITVEVFLDYLEKHPDQALLYKTNPHEAVENAFMYLTNMPPTWIRSLLKECGASDPPKRPSCEDILQILAKNSPKQ